MPAASAISARRRPGARRVSARQGSPHFCLHVADVDAARAELRRRGVDLVGEPFEIEAISRRPAFFREPWGT
jgi:hypothetical protein